MAKEEVPTNMALMAFSDSEVQKDKTCSSLCLKSFETLKAQYDKLRINCNKTEFDLANYKRPLASVEEQLAFYKQNEKNLRKKKRIICLKYNYDNATKSLDKVIGSQLIDNNKKGLGYNVVPPPPTGLFIPPSFEDLKSQYDNLRIELNKSEFDLANYKRGLASVEEQLVFYKKNEGMLCDQIAVLKRDASFNESEINALKIQIERLKKEKERCQISDNNRKGVGYNAVPPPPTGLFAPPTIDLSNSGLEEFKQPEFEGYGVKVNKSVSENSSNEIKKTSGAPIIEDWVSDCDEDETLEKVSESANVQKPKQADQPRKISQNPRNNSTNWNTPMSKKLGLEFCDKHNMVAYLVKSESSKGFDEIIDFLTSSHIYYALTENLIIFVSLIEQFWETAVLSTIEEGLQAIFATIDGHE
ncbi:hypothetical protein Tco_0422689 [Tanacetum coccineum]